MRKKFNKIVGKIDLVIADQYNIQEYADKEIVQSLDLYAHVYKHVPEFESIDNYNNTMLNIEKIINEPIFVYYDKDRNSLLYFKKIDENVCAVVKLTLRKNKDIYVATVYPISEDKIVKYKDKALIDNYTYKGELD